jgi:hypothetical protein
MQFGTSAQLHGLAVSTMGGLQQDLEPHCGELAYHAESGLKEGA